MLKRKTGWDLRRYQDRDILLRSPQVTDTSRSHGPIRRRSAFEARALPKNLSRTTHKGLLMA